MLSKWGLLSSMQPCSRSGNWTSLDQGLSGSILKLDVPLCESVEYMYVGFGPDWHSSEHLGKVLHNVGNRRRYGHSCMK